MSQEQERAEEHVAVETERIVEQGEDIRERTRKAFVDAFNRGVPSVRRLSELAGRMLDGAVEGLRDIAPKDRPGAFGEVVDGLADGMSSTANAARLALEEAAGRGTQFARDDVQRLVDDLQSMEHMFLDSVERTTKNAGSVIQEETSDLVRHATRAFERVRPSVQAALDQAQRHPIETASGAVTGAVRAVPAAAGVLLQTMGGMLQGAGDVLRGTSGRHDAKRDGE